MTPAPQMVTYRRSETVQEPRLLPSLLKLGKVQVADFGGLSLLSLHERNALAHARACATHALVQLTCQGGAQA